MWAPLKSLSLIIATRVITIEYYDCVTYNQKTGYLSYNACGSGKVQAVGFASLKNKLALNYDDFFAI